jgi:hypothetical protein
MEKVSEHLVIAEFLKIFTDFRIFNELDFSDLNPTVNT